MQHTQKKTLLILVVELWLIVWGAVIGKKKMIERRVYIIYRYFFSK
jgi:hypothetical protein